MENGFLIINPEDRVPEKNLVIVLYGLPGVGKTSLAYTAADPLLFDFDQGLERAVKRKRSVKFNSWQGVQNFIQQHGFKGVKTLILDTSKTMLDDYIGAFVVGAESKNAKKGGGISQTGYGAMKEIFSAFLRQAQAAGVDLVFISHADKEKEGDATQYIPAMTGGSFNVLMGKADLVGYMETRNNRLTLNFNPTDRNIGKNSAEFPLLTIPDYRHPDFDLYLARLIAEAKAALQGKSDEAREAMMENKKVTDMLQTALEAGSLAEVLATGSAALKLPESYKAAALQAVATGFITLYDRTIVAAAADCEALTALSKAADEIPEEVGWFALRKPCKQLILNRSKVLGCSYDKTAKAFVAAATA